MAIKLIKIACMHLEAFQIGHHNFRNSPAIDNESSLPGVPTSTFSSSPYYNIIEWLVY